MAAEVNWAKHLEDQLANKDSKTKVANNDAKDQETTKDAQVSLLEKIIRKGLVESKFDVEIQRQNPNSPFYSVTSFEALPLHPNLLKGVYQMGFNVPSKIQEIALPALLAYPPQNLIAQSQSGTGKTATFVLSMLSRVDPNKHYPQVLCLSPTYELAIQTGKVATRMAMFCPEIKLRYAVRGEKMPRETKMAEHIIIGTPGKVLDWCIKYHVFDLSKIAVFVLDEADIMIATQGHQDQCIRIHKCLNKKCQMMFFSATYDQEVIEFAEVIVPDPLIIRLRRDEEILDNVKQYYVKCIDKQEKYDAVTNIFGTLGIGQTIIFCHTRNAASWLAEKISQDGHAVALLTGDLSVEQRLAVLNRFRNGKEKVLIATNVLSRGIDVEQVTVIVNYDLPVDANGKPDCETYLHRIGRAGRFGKRGIAVNLIDSLETMQVCEAFENHFNRKIKYLNAEDSDEIERLERKI